MVKQDMNIENIISLPPHLQEVWSCIPPDMENINNYLDPLKRWFEKKTINGDRILIQGDFGAVHIMVTFAFSIGLVPIYSTTERVSVDEQMPDNSIRTKKIFKHVRFRVYERE